MAWDARVSDSSTTGPFLVGAGDGHIYECVIEARKCKRFSSVRPSARGAHGLGLVPLCGCVPRACSSCVGRNFQCCTPSPVRLSVQQGLPLARVCAHAPHCAWCGAVLASLRVRGRLTGALACMPSASTGAPHPRPNSRHWHQVRGAGGPANGQNVCHGDHVPAHPVRGVWVAPTVPEVPMRRHAAAGGRVAAKPPRLALARGRSRRRCVCEVGDTLVVRCPITLGSHWWCAARQVQSGCAKAVLRLCPPAVLRLR